MEDGRGSWAASVAQTVMTAPLLFNNQRWEAEARKEVSPRKIQVFGTIKAQLAEMTGFEVERGGGRKRGGLCGE